MKIKADFVDLIKELNNAGVKYCIAGAYSVIYYTRERYTGDIDIYIEPTKENIQKSIEALHKFGFRNVDLNADEILRNKKILQFGEEPNQVHIMQDITGVDSKEIFENAKKDSFGGVPSQYIGLKQLITNKYLTYEKRNKDKDLLDLNTLKEFYGTKYENIVNNIHKANKNKSTIKEPSVPYNEVSIRNEAVLNSVKGFPLEKELEKEMDETVKVIRVRKDFTQQQKHTLANLLSSERLSALWYSRKYTPKMRVAVAEFIADPGNKNNILRNFKKPDRKIIENHSQK